MKKNNKNNKNFKYDLSISLITKNEEAIIERCLKSLLQLKEKINCEIILTDTGSTDKTVEIAQKYVDKLLHFEWCNDFSAARNIGVQASEGSWFMYVDSDEVFYDGLIEFVHFFNSNDRDNYDNASLTIKNYKDKELKFYNIYYAIKLFNFSKNKRQFNGKIHESIPCIDNTFNIKSTLEHFGHSDEVIDSKISRNVKLMRDEFEKTPNDLRNIKHLMDAVEYDEKIELANLGFDIIDKAYGTDYSHIPNSRLALSIYVTLCYAYYERKEYDNILTLMDKFLNCKYFLEFNYGNNTPELEMLFMCCGAYYSKNMFKEAIESLNKYQTLYNIIENKYDQMFGNLVPFMFRSVIAYNTSVLLEVDCYDKIGDIDSAIRVLKEKNISKYNEELDLIKYFEFIKKYNLKEIACDIIEYIRNNKYDYLTNHTVDDIIEFIDFYFNDTDDKILNQLYDIVLDKNEYENLKEMLIYLNLFEKYLLNKSNIIEKLEIELDYQELFELNKMFELYIKNMYVYIYRTYSKEVLEDTSYGIFSKQEKFCLNIYNALEKKDDNLIEYVKSLKICLGYCTSFNYLVSNAINCIKKENEKPKTEFELLGEQIKLTIIQEIKLNNMEKAKLILEQYKKINPTDSDIENLANIINNIN